MIDNIYFDVTDLSIKNIFVLERLSRKFIANSSLVELKSGDILEIVFSKATIYILLKEYVWVFVVRNFYPIKLH